MLEKGSHIDVVTETWMKDDERLDSDRVDLAQRSGFGMINRNREPCAKNGVCYGGVAIICRESMGGFRRVDICWIIRCSVLRAPIQTSLLY